MVQREMTASVTLSPPLRRCDRYVSPGSIWGSTCVIMHHFCYHNLRLHTFSLYHHDCLCLHEDSSTGFIFFIPLMFSVIQNNPKSQAASAFNRLQSLCVLCCSAGVWSNMFVSSWEVSSAAGCLDKKTWTVQRSSDAFPDLPDADRSHLTGFLKKLQ